ncbi:hypothetical protein QJR26_07015 [Clostridium baratii]
MKFIAVRSYRKGYTTKTEKLNSYLQEGWEVVTVTPFMKDGVTEYLEYILREPKKECK